MTTYFTLLQNQTMNNIIKFSFYFVLSISLFFNLILWEISIRVNEIDLDLKHIVSSANDSRIIGNHVLRWELEIMHKFHDPSFTKGSFPLLNKELDIINKAEQAKELQSNANFRPFSHVFYLYK